MGVYVKGNPKEGEYKLIKTTDGFALMGKDIAYACIEIEDEAIDIAQDIIDGCKELKERINTDLVRCGECKYYEESEYIEGDMVCKYHMGDTYYTEADRFCSYGERRADGDI